MHSQSASLVLASVAVDARGMHVTHAVEAAWPAASLYVPWGHALRWPAEQ